MQGRMSLIVLVALMTVSNLVLAEKLFDLNDDLAQRKTERASSYQIHYLVINSELVKATESTDPEENIALIKKITEENASWLDSSVKLEAVDLFASLPKSLEGCGFKSYKVLVQNYIAVQGRSHNVGGLRRVDAIVRHYVEEHAKMCRPKYAQIFEDLKKNLDQEVLDHVSEMFKDLTENDIVKWAKKEYQTNVDIITTGLVEMNINLKNTLRILENLEKFVADPADKKLLYAVPDELNGGYIMSAKFRKNIFEKYIEEPCLKYLAKSRHLFAPARFDAALEDDAQATLLHPADEAFRQAWVNHRLCQYMIRRTQWDHFKEVIAGRVPNISA